MIDADGWIVDRDLMIISPLGEIIDKSLRQTHEASLGYAVIPRPWLEDWIVWRNPLRPGDAERRTRERLFWWRMTCGFRAMLLMHHSPVTDKYFDDGDGNFILCLRRPRHYGEICGGAHLRTHPGDSARPN